MNSLIAKVVVHLAQLFYILHPALIKVIIAGRGWGKTTAMWLNLYQCIVGLPGGRGFIVGLTYNQILTKFLPPGLKILKILGIKKYNEETDQGDYVIGKQPPDWFKKPIQEIESFRNIMIFSNGTYLELLSMDRSNLNLGGNYDFGAVDEVQNINEHKLEKDYIIATRSTDFPLPGATPAQATQQLKLINRIFISGTMPWNLSGQWIFKYEELAKKYPNQYLFYTRKSTDNIDLLKKPYFVNLKRILSPMMYAIEIENLRAKIISGGFYPSFSEEKHTYFNSYEYNDNAPLPSLSKLSSYTTTSKDYNQNIPLEIAFDFGANVTILLVCQEENNEQKIIDMFTENANSSIVNSDKNMPDELLQRIVTRFLKSYKTHKQKIHIYGDHTGHNRSAGSKPSFIIVENMLKAAGLTYDNKAVGKKNPAHESKYYIINGILSETNAKCPKLRINSNTCKDLILSIQVSPVTNDFKKDKASERDKKLAPSMQTHASDALDYILVSKFSHHHPLGASQSATMRFNRK